MSCASAIGTEDNYDFYVFQDDEDDDNDVEVHEGDEQHSQDINFSTILHMPEAQDQQQNDKSDGSLVVLVEEESDDDDDADRNVIGEAVVELDNVRRTAFAGYTEADDVGIVIDDSEPDELMANLANDEAAAETANLLLPEERQTNFVDFDEFNICLNNILNDDDVDVEAELSPSIVIDDALAANHDVDHIFKMNSSKNTSTMQHNLLDGMYSKNLNTGGSSSSSNVGAHDMHNNILGNHRNDMLNMVQFEHMEFSFDSELSEHAETATTPSAVNDVHDPNYNQSSKKVSFMEFLKEDNLVDHIPRMDVKNPLHTSATATVSASVTATTNASSSPSSSSNNKINMKNNVEGGDNDDSDSINVVAGDDTRRALNAIKRNNHSIVNIFQ